ncbi:MAG: helicase-related protein, partial [Thermotogota bacterium]|nr:helicase-related protein [Thermotogota bacterium]
QKLGSPSLYEDLTAKRKPLINFTVNEKAEYTGLSNFTLMYPCLTLAREVDPLIEGFGNSTQKKTLHYSEVFSSIKEKIQNMLYPIIEKYNIQSGQKAVRTQTPVRWYWLSMVLLDQHFYHDYYLVWLDQDNNENNWRDMITSRNQEEDDTAFSEHIDYLHEFFKNQNMFNDIGDPPEDLYDVLTEIAIGSPALIVLRSLMRQVDLKDPSIYINHLLSSSAFAAVHFRTLFNLPYAISVVQKYSNKDYWRAVLEYCTRGNLQAVVDEYTHVLKESLGLIDSSPGEIFSSITEELGIALSLRTVNLKFDHFEVNEDKIIESTSHTLRCRYALNFGAAETDDGTRSRPDHVRKAFNSPFQPFILATTSIGQEGLDFHHYCHNIYHWNLPTNPVDMEQREGRVHRYKGHAVRLNCVDEVPPSILRESIENLQDPWKIIFSYCEKNRPDEVNDLVPYWININNGGHPKYRICRHIPTLPLSREVTQLRNLRRSLVAYRMVFGQPRQEDLIHYLQERDSENKLDLEELLKYRIDLSP